MALRDIGAAYMGDVFMAAAEVPLADEPWESIGTDVSRITFGQLTGLGSYQLVYGDQAQTWLRPTSEGYAVTTPQYGAGWCVSTWRLWWQAATPDATLSFAQVHWGTLDILLTWESDGYVRFRASNRTGTIWDAAANPFTLQTWHKVEVKWDPNVGDYGRLTFSVDGTIELTFDTASAVVGSPYYIEWGGGSDKNVDPNTLAKVDNIFFTRISALEPPNGDAPDVLHGHPNGAGTHNDWSGDYEDWDDAAAGGASDGDTTYRGTGAGSGVKKATDLATDFWGNSYDDIYGVMLVSVVKRPVSPTNYIYIYGRVGSDEEGVSVLTSPEGTYDAVYASYDKQPDQSSAWTPSALDALEIGMYRKDEEIDWRCTEVYYYVASLEGSPPIEVPRVQAHIY